MSITKINIACTYQLFAVKTKLIFNFYSSKILGEPNFMAAMNVPGWDVVTLNNMAIKFDPSSINTGNSYQEVGCRMLQLSTLIPPACVHKGHTLFELPIS